VRGGFVTNTGECRRLIALRWGFTENAFSARHRNPRRRWGVLRLIARMILELRKHPEYLEFLGMVVADPRQFPRIAEEFAAVMEPQTGRELASSQP
jgi:hypothetical protein